MMAIDTNRTNGNVLHINYVYFFLMAVALVGLGRLNNLRIIAFIPLVVLLLWKINSIEFSLSYFVLLFFEPILDLPILGFSFFRIYQFIFIIRVLYDYTQKRGPKPQFSLNVWAVIVFVGTSFLYVDSMSSLVSPIINSVIIIYFLLYYQDDTSYLSQMLAIIGLFSAASGMYGFFFGRQIISSSYIRYSSVIDDPNYSAMFYVLGILSLYGTNAINKYGKIVLIGILIVLVGLTVSITGAIGLVLLSLGYVLFVNPQKAVWLLVGLGVLIGVIGIFGFNTASQATGLFLRLQGKLLSFNLNTITSGRYAININYMKAFQQLPLRSKLFGGQNILSGELREQYISEFHNVSHNSFIDMLYMIGIVGLLLIVSTFIYMIYTYLREYYLEKDRVKLSLGFLKITVLFFSLSISIYPFRYFLVVFLL